MSRLINASGIRVGSSSASKVMLGGVQVWPDTTPDLTGGIRQQSTGTWMVSGDMEITLPDDTLETSLLVLIIAGNTVVPTPAGWTLRESQVNQMGHYLFTRPANTASSWVTTPNSSAPAACTWYLAEVINGEYDTGASIHSTATGTEFSTPSVVPTGGRRLLLASIASARDGGDENTINSWTNDFVEVADVYINHHDGPMQGVAIIEINSDGTATQSTTGTFNTHANTRSAIIASIITTGGDPVNSPPVADFVTSLDEMTVTIDASSSSDSDGAIVNYEWDFGDSQTGSGETTQHTYAAPGTYAITLVVTDDRGGTGQTTREVTIEEASVFGGIRQQSTGTWQENGDMEITLPDDTLETSLLALVVSGNTTVPTPAGWTLRESQVSNMGHYLFTRPANTASSWIVTPNASTPAACTWYLAEIINGQYDTGASAHNNSGDMTYSTPSLTPSAGNRLILASVGSVRENGLENSVTSWTNSFTEVADVHVGHNDGPMQGIATLEVNSIGSTSYSTTGTYNLYADSRSAIIASFITPASGPSAELLAVVSSVPAAGATGVSQTGNIVVTMNENLNPATVSTSSVLLRDSSDNPVTTTVSYNNSTREITIQPTAELSANTQYTVTLTSSVEGVSGSSLGSNYTWSFTTLVAADDVEALIQGHGGPIAIITSGANKFSSYYSEILRAEGVNSFRVVDIAETDTTLLEDYEVAILGDFEISTDQVATLTNWVNDGGNLIAMRPDKKLAELMGLTDQSSTLDDAYLLIDTSQSPGAGLVDQTIQFHSTADRYTASTGTTVVAYLYDDASTSSANPAVSMRSVGENGGHAVAFTYDLARSVIYTHQGNPDWSADDRNGDGVIRPSDLFIGNKSGDSQTDYIDLDKVAIPQADEQQRLLANILNEINSANQPLPKFSYFPYNDKVVMVLSSDDHANGRSSVAALNHQIAESPPMCSVDDWECIRSTSLIYTNTDLSEAEALNYYNQGFDFGVHMNTGCMNWTESSLSSFLDGDLTGFRNKYPSLPNQTSNRIHCIAWSDYITAVKVERSRGIRMDLNYYYWPGEWVQNRPGYMTGSGMSMRFADLDGTLLDVYQLPTHLVNESGQSFPQNINLMLDRALGTEGYYGVLGTHYDYSDSFDRQLVASCKSRNVRMVSVQQLLDWNDGRNASYFSNSGWSGNTFTFTATVDNKMRAMGRVLLPMQGKNGVVSEISRAGSPVSYTTETMKGVTYAVFTATTGTYDVTYGDDTTPPQVVSTVPLADAVDVNRNIQNIIVTMNEPLDPATVNEQSVLLLEGLTEIDINVSYNTAEGNIVIQPVSALTPSTTYTISLTTGISDTHGNTLTAAFSSSFTTSEPGESALTFWAPAPQTVNYNEDPGQLQIGVRFSSSQAGEIAGIYFQKAPNDTETTHTTTLWSPTGVSMGTATTTDETGSGWQYAEFETPVSISAGSTYTASVLSPTGWYSFTSGGLGSGPVTRGPLTIPLGGGVFTYDSNMPSQSFANSNYWVDIRFI